MARDDSWAPVLRVAVPLLDRARPSGVFGWAGPVGPGVTRAARGAGDWAAGRRRWAQGPGRAGAAVTTVPWAARAVRRRRPRMAAGYALVVAGSVARLRAASAEPLR